MHRLFYIFFILIAIVLDIFLFQISSDIRIFGILFFYIVLIKLFKLKSNATFMLALILFLFAYLQYVFTDPVVFSQPVVPRSERTAVWVYLFLVIGVIQRSRE